MPRRSGYPGPRVPGPSRPKQSRAREQAVSGEPSLTACHAGVATKAGSGLCWKGCSEFPLPPSSDYGVTSQWVRKRPAKAGTPNAFVIRRGPARNGLVSVELPERRRVLSGRPAPTSAIRQIPCVRPILDARDQAPIPRPGSCIRPDGAYLRTALEQRQALTGAAAVERSLKLRLALAEHSLEQRDGCAAMVDLGNAG